MSPKLLVGAILLGILIIVLGGADTVHAQTFNPVLEVTVANPEPEANSDYTVDFSLPDGDVQFAGIVAFIPPDWGVTPGDEIPVGALVGQLTSQAQLGLFNNACNNVLPVLFNLLNSSIDINDTVPYEDTDDNNVDDFAEDKDNSGIPDAFEKYPDFINRVLEDEGGQPQQPIRRSAGITIIAGTPILLQFLIFEPGTFIDEDIPFDEELGYPSVTLLINAGDPDIVPVPGPINDFCSPLLTQNTSFGISKDNACTDDSVPVEELDPLCEVTGFHQADEGVTTTPDESGHILFTNPQDGTYTFVIEAVGQRDADDDGYENSLDTCAFDPNEGEPRIGGDGDADNDGLDAACDPDDNVVNSDEDLDGYVNRQDNCPLTANGDAEDNQHDEDLDQIGDACDPDPDDADAQGVLQFVEVSSDVVIGTGTGPGGPPSGFESGTADGGGGDGGGGSALIIIIVVIAVVVVGGGGAFLYMRRGSGGGGGGGGDATA